MPHQFGILNVVASLGTALTVEQIRLLSRYTKNVILLFDADAAGEAAMMRSLDLLVEEGVNARMATLSEGDDPDSFLRKHGAEAFKERLQAAENVFDYKINRLLGQFGSATLEARSKIVQEMLPTLRRFRDEVLRCGYLKALAERLQVGEEAVMMEFRKFQQSPAWNERSGENKTPQVSVPANITSAEWQILKLMLDDNGWIIAARQSLETGDFQHAGGRMIVEKIFDHYDRYQRIQPAVLLAECEEEQTRQFLTALLVDDENAAGDKQKLFQDCLQRLKADRRKGRRQELLKAISQAEQKGDWTALQNLQEEFTQLTKTS